MKSRRTKRSGSEKPRRNATRRVIQFRKAVVLETLPPGASDDVLARLIAYAYASDHPELFTNAGAEPPTSVA